MPIIVVSAVMPSVLVENESVIIFKCGLTNWSKSFGRKCVTYSKIDNVCNKSTNEDSISPNQKIRIRLSFRRNEVKSNKG